VLQQFSVANISGSFSGNSNLRIYIDGSGPFLQRPWTANDWLRTNFLAIITFGVHLGYLIAAIRVVRRFREQIKEAKTVTITGHSLGGATAEVAALIISFMVARGRVLYKSFGGPAPWWFVTSWLLWILYKLRDVDGLWYISGGVRLGFCLLADPVGESGNNRAQAPCDRIRG